MNADQKKKVKTTVDNNVACKTAIKCNLRYVLKRGLFSSA